MSHVAVRIVADWLKDNTNGVNAIAADVPRLDADEAPDSVTVYDETRDAWVMRGLAPDSPDATAGIAFPAVSVSLYSGDFDGGRGTRSDSGVIREGSVQIAVQLLLRAADTVDGVTDSMYLARGIAGSLMLLDNATDAQRTQAYTRIGESTDVKQVKMKAERGDLVVASALLVTYPVWESTPVTA